MTWTKLLLLLFIDEGISGYRDDSLETVKRNRDQYGLPLKILSYQDLYGWTMDQIVSTVGRKNNCTFCGVFRRQALDRGAMQLGVNKIVTGKDTFDYESWWTSFHDKAKFLVKFVHQFDKFFGQKSKCVERNLNRIA